jgi:uncharacterized protein (DUF1499 family)
MKASVASMPIVIAVAAALMVVASGFGARFGVWDYRLGFGILRWSIYVALAATALAIIALAVPKIRAGRQTTLVLTLAAGLCLAYLPWSFFQQAREAPPINDITTDLDNPPLFDKILPLRAGSPVAAAYHGPETAAAQRKGYPDLKPLVLAVPPAAAFARALDTASQMGWDLVAVDPATGRIEAVATTPWFGFKDDVVIRVGADPAGSRIDVRSVSRVGRGDLGVNARRIRRYLAQIAP